MPPEVSEATSSSDEEIEKKPRKSRAKPKEKVYDMGSPKPKKTASEAQIRNLEKGRLRRDEIRKQRINERTEKEAEAKVVLEERIVKKAICIKKKQLKKENIPKRVAIRPPILPPSGCAGAPLFPSIEISGEIAILLVYKSLKCPYTIGRNSLEHL